MGKLTTKIFLFTISVFSITSCSEKNNDTDVQNDTVIINSNLYKVVKTNNYTITDVQLNGNKLTIKISSSGCSGNSWKAKLIDANEILESNSVQRNIKLSLENNEACLAVFEKEFEFNIQILKENFSEIILNLDGWNSQINYQ